MTKDGMEVILVNKTKMEERNERSYEYGLWAHFVMFTDTVVFLSD